VTLSPMDSYVGLLRNLARVGIKAVDMKATPHGTIAASFFLNSWSSTEDVKEFSKVLEKECQFMVYDLHWGPSKITLRAEWIRDVTTS